MSYDEMVSEFPTKDNCPVCGTELVWRGTSDCAPSKGCPKCNKGINNLKED